MQSRDDILRVIESRGPELRKLGVRGLGLFGSRARGTERADSDLDFVVDLDKRTFDSYMDVKLFLEDLFGRRVDLVLSESIKPRLRKTILDEAVHAPGF